MTRSEQREQAFLLIFERTFKDENLEEILESAELARDLEITDFAKQIFNGVIANQNKIDSLIDNNSVGWKKERLSRVTLSALRLAIYEMLYEDSIPKSVSINEAVEIVKKYGTKGDSSFTNGILSGVYKELKSNNV